MAKNTDTRQIENQEWIASLRWVLEHDSGERAKELLHLLMEEAASEGVALKAQEGQESEYQNTISPHEEKEYPGDQQLEKRIYAAIRWNAMAMVARANKKIAGIGGHISTYSSASTLWEVGLNHFWNGYDEDYPDLVYFQGHAAPGLYARSFVEHRFDEENLDHFRLEVQNEKGLSSYPHPRLMPEYWRFPTVSMGLAGLQAIYQARFLKYLQKREISDSESRTQRVWALLGDGEMDEPESTGAIAIAAREKLDNLCFVINCNLQRLDGPVRGNNKVIEELEGLFNGAGWNVIKVIWGSAWEELFEKDKDGALQQKLNETPDGEFQHIAQYTPEDWREKFFTDDLASLVEDWEDERFDKLIRGGHDPVKVYNAYLQATETEGKPTVILAHTVKGWEQGEAGEASNVTHKTKEFNADALKAFRDELELDIKDDQIEDIPYFRFEKDSDELSYLQKLRKKLQGDFPARKVVAEKLQLPDEEIYEEFAEGAGDNAVPTTGVFVKILTKLLKDENTGKAIVPIIPDESRTFGMDSLFKDFGIYAAEGQKYEPVDKDSLLFYNESKQGAIIEEGITEAGAMATFIASGTSHITQPIYSIPFFVFYSMFGFQRIGDLIWAASDARAKGFLIGGISGRTSLSGEGLQHTDGQSHHFAMAFPNVMAYDPAFAFELAAIIKNGLKRMYEDDEDLMYYITIGNQAYQMPAQPDDIEDDLLKGLYRFQKSDSEDKEKKVNLLGSGQIMAEVQKAAKTLAEDFEVSVDIWSVTSYKTLYDEARDVERKNLREGKDKPSHIEKQLKDQGELFVAASDYVKTLPLSLAKWIPGELIALGTDGFGRSDTVAELRDYFEVDADHIVYHSLAGLLKLGHIEEDVLTEFKNNSSWSEEKDNPAAAL